MFSASRRDPAFYSRPTGRSPDAGITPPGTSGGFGGHHVRDLGVPDMILHEIYGHLFGWGDMLHSNGKAPFGGLLAFRGTAGSDTIVILDGAVVSGGW
jgi:hypothetical protein